MLDHANDATEGNDRFTFSQLWKLTQADWAARVGLCDADKHWILQYADKKRGGPLWNPEIIGGHIVRANEDGTYPENEWDDYDAIWDRHWGAPVVDVRPRWLFTEACVALADRYWHGNGIASCRVKAVGLLYRYIPSDSERVARVLSWLTWESPSALEELIASCRRTGGDFTVRALSRVLEHVGSNFWQRSVYLMRKLRPLVGQEWAEVRALNAAIDHDLGTEREEWFRRLHHCDDREIYGAALNFWRTALSLGEKAVELGNTGAGYEFFNWVLQNPPISSASDTVLLRKALSALECAANSGRCEAQVWMGDLHYMGLVQFPRDFREAAQWFKKAADKEWDRSTGSADRSLGSFEAWACGEAAYCLGYLHLFGQGIAKDKEKAREYFRRAVEFGGSEEEARRALRFLQPLKWTDRLIRLEPPGRKWKKFTTGD
jgi:Sel1 repeat